MSYMTLVKFFKKRCNTSRGSLVNVAGAAEKVELLHSRITYNNGTKMDLENVFKALREVKKFDFFAPAIDPNVSDVTVKKLLIQPLFVQLVEVSLMNLPSTFDMEVFYGYILQNKLTKIGLSFCRRVPRPYVNRLNEIVQEIINHRDRWYKSPCLHYREMLTETYNRLGDIHDGYVYTL
uniref:Uncharacterized protein n=1 Tax=Panagrolaimus davidi TaxID=227884 RepID=A0A914QW60_9BILA